jgi:vanillate O-demethylase ferredoxin subunit
MEPLELVVTAKETVAADTVRLRLQRPDGGPLPAAAPGAHLALDLAGRVRRYSVLRGDAAPASYEIGVLHVPSGQGGSRFIHEQLAVGDRLALLEVVQEFALDAEAPHVLLVGGGIGITPLISMAEQLRAQGRSFALHQVVRAESRRWPLPPTLRAAVHVGREQLDLHRLLAGQPPGSAVYVCGPASLIQSVREAASRLGWPADRIHAESFGASADAADRPLRVTLVQSGLTLTAEPGTPLLDTLLAAGVWTGYECRRGTCGACVTEVVSGQPIHRDSLDAALRGSHTMCTCVSWARGPELHLNL